MISLIPSRREGVSSAWKPMAIRFFDLLFAVIGIFVSLPIMLFIIVAIKLNSRGPAFFIQERLGQFKRPFRLIKFRTMVEDAEACGPQWATAEDDRVTAVGHILRKTRMDELPQLFNILRGDLSFVGPRPIRRCFADLLEQHSSDYEKRFRVKPGLTGWAQIYAPYGTTVEEQLKKLPYDLRYLQGLPLSDYFRVILLTSKTVMTGKGV